VPIAEKLSYGGGNCLNSGGFLFDVDGPHAVDHLDGLCFGKTPRSMLHAFATGLHEVEPWLRSLGGEAPLVDPGAFGGMLPSWPHFPGGGHVTLVPVGHPGNTGDAVRLALGAGASLWHMGAVFGWLRSLTRTTSPGSRSTSTGRASSTSTPTAGASPIARRHADALAHAIGGPELPATLAAYCERLDPFGRAEQTIVPLEPPLYAIELRPGPNATQ
jgi:hypothetical protein